MSEILIIVLIIVTVILLFVLLYLLTKLKFIEKEPLITGGDGFLINFPNESSRIVTFSEIVLDEKYGRFVRNNLDVDKSFLSEILNLSTDRFENMGTIRFNKEICYINKNITPKFFSDGLLDGLMLFQHRNFDKIICKCEYPSESLYKMDKTDIEKGFNNKPNSIPYSITKNDDKIHISKSLSFYKKYLENPKFVFIEFVYPGSLKKSQVIDLYPLIHAKTIETIQRIVKIELSKKYSGTENVYIFRFDIDELETSKPFSHVNIGKISIFKNELTKGKFYSLNIPPTTE